MLSNPYGESKMWETSGGNVWHFFTPDGVVRLTYDDALAPAFSAGWVVYYGRYDDVEPTYYGMVGPNIAEALQAVGPPDTFEQWNERNYIVACAFSEAQEEVERISDSLLEVYV